MLSRSELRLRNVPRRKPDSHKKLELLSRSELRLRYVPGRKPDSQ